MITRIAVLLSLGLFSIGHAFALDVGVTAGPHATIMEFVKKEYEKKGHVLKIVEFNDFILPNIALNEGDISANSYQHQAFLDDQILSRGYSLVAVAKTILLPLGIYSSKFKNIDSVPQGARVSIPNDPTNGSRALLLLKKAGFIELSNLTNPSVLDISKNLKKLKISEIEAPQLPRTLEDVDFSVINTDWVLISGMNPNSSLLKEDQNSPYSNLLVVKKGTESRSDIRDLISTYHSQRVKDFILTHFKGAILPAW